MTQAKAYKGMGMEGRVAKWYAKTTRSAMDDFKVLAKRMSEGLTEGSSVLEVAPGPGYFAIELAKLGNYKITGLDISKTFVDIASKNARAEGVEVNFRHGNASSMPFEDNTFDRIVCRAAFKNFADPVGALKEMRRVLRPGGKALIIDLRKDTPKEVIAEHVDNMKIGPLDSAFTKLAFRTFLLRRAYTRDNFTKFIAESGFQKSEIDEAPLGFEIWLAK
ncbi:MAG: class I SAM-dependent methyltransferase [Candidatus Acidiferrales bacterium]